MAGDLPAPVDSCRLRGGEEHRDVVADLTVAGGEDVTDFRRDGSQLVSAAADGAVHVWALRLDDLEAIARDSLTRGLTTDECRRYLHADRCPDN
ncbi:MAG: hypothetical protein ACRD08_24355 [Acidimicrobiales bacterium]